MKSAILFAAAILLSACTPDLGEVRYCDQLLPWSAAEALWGATEDCTDPTVRTWVEVLPEPALAKAHRVATWRAGDGWGIAVTSRALDRPYLDLIVAHEVGHLLGHEHSGDKCDIMFPDSSWDEGCIRNSY